MYSRISDESRRRVDPYAIYQSMFLENYPEEPAGVTPDEVSEVGSISEKIKRTPPLPISRPQTSVDKSAPVSEKSALTNEELANQYDALAFLRRDETQRSGVQTIVWNGNIYGGGMKSVGDSKKLQKDINKYNKDRPRSEDPVMGFAKNVVENISSAAKKFSEGVNKKGGGRVSSRPAKVMKKMYAKGGSVRKPKRIK